MSSKRQRRVERAQREKVARVLVDRGLAPKRRSLIHEPGDTFDYACQLAANQEQIVISVATPHGRRKLYTFSNKDQQGAWWPATPIGKLASPTTGSFVDRYAAASKQRLHSPNPEPNDPLGAAKTVHLEDGFDPPASVLAFILDALHSDKRHDVDLDDIKVVVSQLGSKITKLSSLDDEQRRHAEPALYAEILRRCTTL
jgi:hypothetical protein